MRTLAATLWALLILAVPAAWGQTGTLAPVAMQQFLTSTGAVCNGCKVYFFQSGSSTTAQPVYTTSDVNALTGVAHAQPIVLNSAGRPASPIYLSATSYRVRVDGSDDVTLYTVDPVSAVPTTAVDLDIQLTAGEAIAAGDVVYVADAASGNTVGRVYQADADNTYESSTAAVIGIAPSAITSGSSGTIRLAGRVTGLSGLTAGEWYFISATAGALTATPPTNTRFIGIADSTTSLVMGGNYGSVRLADSDGTHSVVLATSSNLTADRLLTIVPGDAARTLTLTGNATVDQDVSSTSTPNFNWAETAGGRCTLTSGTAVTSADVTAATSLYYTPYTSNRIALYDGTNWDLYTFSERTLSLASLAANTNFDVFLYDSSGTLTLESVAWTNDTTRATALTTQNGISVKSGSTTKRYVCTFRTTGSVGQTEDSLAKRFLWNAHNRRPTPLIVAGAGSWTYTTSTWRYANNDAANRLALVVGLAEDALDVSLTVHSSNSTTSIARYVGIGEDTTAAPTVGYPTGAISGATNAASATATMTKVPAVGFHYYAWLEYSEAAGTTTWYGAGTSASAISAVWWR